MKLDKSTLSFNDKITNQATIPWYRGIARRKTVCTSCRSLIGICSWVATSTGASNWNTFVVMPLAMLLKMALFASSEIHVGKPSHESIFRYTICFLGVDESRIHRLNYTSNDWTFFFLDVWMNGWVNVFMNWDVIGCLMMCRKLFTCDMKQVP